MLITPFAVLAYYLNRLRSTEDDDDDDERVYLHLFRIANGISQKNTLAGWQRGFAGGRAVACTDSLSFMGGG
jgi:hypothetical protein